MMSYKSTVRFEKSGLADRAEQKKYREIARRVVAGVCAAPCAAEIRSVCTDAGIRGAEVNILFTDDASIREINREYREIDRATDVLSFPFNDFTYGSGSLPPCAAGDTAAPLLLGDIVVSVPAVKRQAREYGHSEERECAFLLCHGMLHLLGYDHTTEEEEQQMFGFADEILAALRYTRDAGSV